MDDLSRDELISLVQQQQAQLAERDAVIAVQQEQLHAQREVLESLANEVKLLKRALFGNRRERFVHDPSQRTLFESQWLGPEPSEGHAGAEDGDGQPSSSRRRRGGKRGRIVIPESLPRKQVVHPLREEDLPEHLRGRADLRRFRKPVGQYVEWVEASAYVVEEFVEVLAADNTDATATEMHAASRPPRILDCYVGPGLLAGIATERFADFLPYYRVEERLGRVGLAIPRSTIARWMIDLSTQLRPLIELMREQVLASGVLCIDETPVMLLQPGRSQAATAYLWTTVGDAAHPYNAFYFTENRSRAGPERFLRDFSGVLVSDAYVCYESLQSAWSERMRWACCHAHARRKFEAMERLGSTPQTIRALAYFRQLFELEDQTRALTDAARHEHRQQYSRPVLTAMKQWMDEQLAALRPKHPLRGAIQYMTKRWESFARFLESGAIPLENNAAERSVKLPVIAKKNHLFFASTAGGEAAMIYYTLTSTCRRLHVDPSAYLRDLFTQLPQTPGEALADLLPDRWLSAHPQHRLELREREADDRAQRKRDSRAKRRRALWQSLRGRLSV
jgi:transposase